MNRLCCAALLLAGCAGLPPSPTTPPAPTETRSDRNTARGVVFEDLNGNGVLEAGEAGIENVAVSNGREVVLTDAAGRYHLPVDDDTILFTIKPRNWVTPIDENGLPRFYYIHKPSGSPSHLHFSGVEPTGPLPASVDFPLRSHPETETFRMVLFGDTQPRSIEEVDHLSHDIIEEVIGTDAAFGMTLGDLVGDDLSLFSPLNRAIGRVGIPWYSVIGNHDLNHDARDDVHSDETFEHTYGPSTYAFAVGAVHFVVLDDVTHLGPRSGDGKQGGYRAGLSQRQLEFLKNYLGNIARDELVVLAMHIPLDQLPERRKLLETLSNHPYTLSLSGHTHLQYHEFYSAEEGYTAGRPHHHLNQGAAAGSWWLGTPDERGIPHATMRDGSPNGWSVIEFDGRDYKVRFKAARRPGEHQMNIYAPDGITSQEAGSVEVLVNVFAGSVRSTVEMRVGAGTHPGLWTRLKRQERVDPEYQAVCEREAARQPQPRFSLPAPVQSRHIWVGKLPEGLTRGTWVIEVRSVDMYGQHDFARRTLRVE